MPPKRRKIKESEEDILFNEKITESFYKYRHDEDSEENSENVGMFESEEQPLKILIEDIPLVVKEVGMKWDSAVLTILDQDQKRSRLIGIETMKLILETLKTVEKQQNDIEYLFKTFSDPESKTITHESLSKALKHLSIRESSDKISLLLAFGHEQSFLNLILSEQTSGHPISSFANRSGLKFDEFKRTFIRSTYLANLK